MKLPRKAFHVSPLGLAIAGAIGPLLLSIVSLVDELPRFVDPCMSWGITSGRQPFDPDCRGRMRGTSQTKMQAIIRIIVVQGGMLGACAAALVGAYRYRVRLSLAAFAFMLLLSVPLSIGNFGIVTILSAICFGFSSLLVARQVRQTSISE